MMVELYKLNADIPFDIVAQDRNGKTILLVEVKARHLKNQQHKDWFIEKVKSYLQAVNAEIPFAMLVDLEDIQIFRCDVLNWSEPIS
jgi:Holliday junction resolvase-like predicted endonuclease